MEASQIDSAGSALTHRNVTPRATSDGHDRKRRCLCSSGWQWPARLLTNHEVRVPIRPVLIVRTDPLFMISMRHRGPPECGGKFGRCGECRVGRIDSSGQSRRDFLKQPAIAIRIAERGKGPVAAMLRIRTPDPQPSEEEGLVRSGVDGASVVEYLANLNAAAEQFLPRRLEVGDDQIQSLRRAGRRRGNVLAEDDRTTGARWRELDHAVVIARGIVCIQSPA